MTEKKEIFIAAILNYLTIALGVIISFFYTPYCLSQLGDKMYGVRAFSLSLVSFLGLLSSAFSGAFLKYRAKLIKEKGPNGESLNNGIFLVIMSFLALIALVVGVAISIIVGFIPLSEYTDSEKFIIQILIIISTFNILIAFPIGVFEMYINANRKFIFVKTISLFTTIVTPLVSTLILYLCGPNDNNVIWISIVVPCVTLAYFPVTLSFALKKLHFKSTFNRSSETKGFIKEITFFSIFVLLSTVFSEFIRQANIMVLGFEHPDDVAVYSLSSTLMVYLTSLGAATIMGLYPKLYQLDSQEQYSQVNDLFIKSVEVSSLVVFLIVGGFIAAGRPFIAAWLGDTYNVSNKNEFKLDWIYQIGCILFCAQLFPLTSLLSIEIIKNRNKHIFQAVALGAMLIVMFGLSIPICNYFGPIGGAWAFFGLMVLCYGVALPIFNLKVLHLSISKYYLIFGEMLLISGVSVGIALFLDFIISPYIGVYYWLMFLIDGSIFVVVYCLGCLIFKRKIIKSIFGSIFNKKLEVTDNGEKHE